MSYENILIPNESIKKKKYNVDHNFIDNPDKKGAYLLGLIWADGYICPKMRSISVSMLKEDMDELIEIFSSIGKWHFFSRIRKNRIKEITEVSTYNPILINKMIEFGFTEKSKLSPDELIKKIHPDDLKYFIRGIVDGDGCFYVKPKKIYQFYITSSYEQNWSYIEKVFHGLKCKYSIKKVINIKQNSKSSYIRITNKKDIQIFINWLYDDFLIEKIGLDRKYQKAKLILSNLS